MLSDRDAESIMATVRMPEAGRALVRNARSHPPARPLQRRMDTVRTRFISRKMDRALLAESRTIELAAIVLNEHREATLEMWPQPFRVDLMLQGANGAYRSTHTPDLLILEKDSIYVEEWRDEDRLIRLAKQRPLDFVRDADGTWHFVSAEKHFGALGLPHRLRSSAELPKKLVTNIGFLEHHISEDAPQPPADVLQRLRQLFSRHAAIPHLQLVHEHGFDAGHVFQAVAAGIVFVDLEKQRLDQVESLIIYRNGVAAAMDDCLRSSPRTPTPSSAMRLQEGTELVYEGKRYTVGMVGAETASLISPQHRTSQVPLAHLDALFESEHIEARHVEGTQPTCLGAFADARRLERAWKRMRMLDNPEGASVCRRTLRRWRHKMAGAQTRQTQLEALLPENPGRPGPRMSPEVLAAAERALREHHNTPKAPSASSTFQFFVHLCAQDGLLPMSRTSFYRWLRDGKESILKREGKKQAYQQAPIPLVFEDDQPVHGTHPHSVVYIDHTCLNQFVKGMNVANLGKPWLSVAIDGSNSEPMALYMDFRSPSAASVLMLFRDYVIRQGRLPDTIVLDNGSEFHSAALLMFCELFRINIRWRRRSRPRDSTLVERFFGTTETEVLASLDGNTRALKDPRSVARTHQPDLYIEWTLPALHGAFEHFMFHIYPNRVHPRFGMTPRQVRQRQLHELGDREHVHVRYDAMFRLMTSVHPGHAIRTIDRQRGVFVSGIYYWHDAFAKAVGKHEKVEVRLEMWCARAVYVLMRGEWLVAQARDGGRLEGRFVAEVETALRQERSARKRLAQIDANSPTQAAQKERLRMPELWDARLRDQMTEAYHLYARLGMVEALDEAKNPRAREFHVGTPVRPDPQLLSRVQEELHQEQLQDEHGQPWTSADGVVNETVSAPSVVDSGGDSRIPAVIETQTEVEAEKDEEYGYF